MMRDIEFPEIEEVCLAIAQESNEPDAEWYVFIINQSSQKLSNIMVASKGYGIKNKESVKTSTLRHFIEELKPKSFKKVEIIKEEVFGINNEYWLSFYKNGKLFDRKFIFLPEVVQAKNFTNIPILNKNGILHP